MQDMTPPISHGDRSIRNIPLSNKPQRLPAGQTGSIRPEPVDDTKWRDVPPLKRPKRQRRLRLVLWFVLGVALICIAVGLLLSTVFAGASVVLYPKTQTVTPPATVSAQPNAPAGVLSYQTVRVTQFATTTTSASGTQHVSKVATGIITIFNVYSTANQPLVAKTRFAAPDGKIYRIQSPVVVPGATKKADGTLTPGSTTASVYADVAGASYNLAQATHFNLPGFAGKPQYATFYAQSQGAITGGFVGDQPAVAAADMTKAQATLQNQLNAAVTTASVANIPSGFLPIANSLSIIYSDIVQTQGADNTVILSQSANGTSAIMRAQDLAAALATQKVDGYNGEAIDFVDSEKITLSVPSGTKPVGELTVLLAGTPVLVWQFDPDVIKQTLLGKNKSDYESIIKTFAPSVERATLTIRPFWESVIPTDQGKLGVTAGQ